MAVKYISEGKSIDNLPNFYSSSPCLYKRLQATRPKDPADSNSIDLPSEYKKTIDDKPFLLNDLSIQKKILVFGTIDSLRDMSLADSVYVDGTFYSAPKQFHQLFTFHYLVNGDMFPSLYILLPNKELITYMKMLRMIDHIANSNGINFEPGNLYCDFESAIIQSFKVFYPNIKIHGCYFHYSQCLLRKINTLGLKKKYDDDDDFRIFFKRCVALPLMQLNDIDACWYLINDNYNNSNNNGDDDDEKIIKFIDYMEQTWIASDARFDREIWNHFANFKTRTINHLEGFHHKLNIFFRRANPDLCALINQLKEMEMSYRIDLLQAKNNQKIHQKKLKYIQLNNNYRTDTASYQNDEIDLIDYLDCCTRMT